MSDTEESNNYLNRPDDLSTDAIPLTPGVYFPKNRTRNEKFSRYPTPNKRFISKIGEFNVGKQNSSHRGFFSKWFVTMVEARWRWTILHFFMAFTANWMFFGFIYWVIALIHGDLTEDHLPPNQEHNRWTPCVANIYGFTSTFLFSIEVHTTVAYGKRAITLECPQAITAMCLQCIFCASFQAIMVGILVAKLSRPKARTQTILFSKQAVVTMRDRKLCMIFRVGDMRKSRILNIKASIFLIKLKFDCKDLVDYGQMELETEMDGCESTFFLWPVSVIHVIDSSSPLYDISAADFLSGTFEFLAVFEGTLESTGHPIQARTSYAECDVLWGHTFVPMVTCDVSKNVFDVNFSKLSEIEQVDMPLCSAREFSSMLSLFEEDLADL